MSDNLKTWPEKIWLSSTEDDIEPFGEVEKHHVEWESEKSFGGDIEYTLEYRLVQKTTAKREKLDLEESHLRNEIELQFGKAAKVEVLQPIRWSAPLSPPFAG
mgnify:CR=1 FL=1